MKKSGFTILELLIVIMLIGLLTTVTIRSYNRARISAELSLLTDNLISDLREQKSEAQSTSENLCVGIKIEEEKITLIEAPYVDPYSKCDRTQIEEIRPYGEEEFRVTSINRQNITTPMKFITILFAPPRGEIFIPETDTPGNPSTDNITLQLSFKEKVSNQLVFINKLNSTIQKTYETSE